MTKALEDYIEAIHVLIIEKGAAHVRDVAESLGVKKPSVVKAIFELKRLGLVEQEPYGEIRLTPSGRRSAKSVYDRHKLLKGFLEGLGVSTANAESDACLMEHVLSRETLDRIREYVSGKGHGGKQHLPI